MTAPHTFNLAAIRSLYPALANKTYFNFGGQGVLSHQVLAKISENFAYVESIGSFSIAANSWVNQETSLLKSAIAHELNVKPETIALTENTTHGCNIALWSFKWQKGDRLLISDCEHPSILAIAKSLQARFGIEVDYFPLFVNADQSVAIETIQKHLQPQTRMVMFSHICWNTGQVLPLAEIITVCHAQDVLVAIDAAQSVGVLPLDLQALDVDFYAFTGHKWWNGALGVGGLYINPRIFASSQPTFAGWRSLVYGSPTVAWRQDAQKFEVATSTYPLYGALKTAIAQGNTFGNQTERYARICELSKYLWEALQEVPNVECIKKEPPKCGLVSFAIANQSHAQVSQYLETNHQIIIRSIPTPDCLRASLQYLNTMDDIKLLVDVLKTL
ncbi:selenocysteine lyase [Synechococcus sp. PCC 7502]|uniref:aminotransferase class V-fold PLP-dependent enzyme n=1 Tax=Synechococcus sp. PCC 7502 TaxID=1173263 RepID=UPI00029F8139|nr:aminotransferase class V-fold PLP-dependent enzyme [Synechococcus sp. PCC 7502]AFY72924.1 selenocysteine lyase [Synechococcus sp. PCC 7502]